MFMPQPLLDFLEGRARQALPFLRAAAKTELTAVQILAEMRAFFPPGATEPLRLQTQRALDIIAALRSRADVNRWIRLAGPATVLPPEAHFRNIAPQRSTFQYVVQVQNAPGEIPEIMTVSSDIPLSWESIQHGALLLAFDESRYEVDLALLGNISFTAVEANVKKGTPGYP